MSDICLRPDCTICRDSRMLDAIAAKCSAEERKYLNHLYCRMGCAEMEIEWRDRNRDNGDMADGSGI